MAALPLTLYASGNLLESLDVNGVTTWSDAFPGVFVSLRAATDTEAAQLADWLARQVAQADATLAGQVATALSGSGPPANSLGVDGALYIDVDSNFAYGPKSGGVWPVGATVALARA